MNNLEKLFNMKLTENGDLAYKSSGNSVVDLIFLAEYFAKNPNEIPINNIAELPEEARRLLCMFVRDPRYGMGHRDYGRILFNLFSIPIDDIVKSGRWDDAWAVFELCAKSVISGNVAYLAHSFYNRLKTECESGNELCKKWMPRLSSGEVSRRRAKDFCNYFNMSHKDYSKLIKANTVENTLSNGSIFDINYEHVPSLAMMKYFETFKRKDGERFQKYLDDVKAGKKNVNFATGTVYDIYRNLDRLEGNAELFFEKLPKAPMSSIVICDTSGSMMNQYDSIVKALALTYYFAKNSTYAPDMFVSFSKYPMLVKLNGRNMEEVFRNMRSTDWGMNTDLGKVFDLLMSLEGEMPEYLIILSDMEVDQGSGRSRERLMEKCKRQGIKPPRIVWWQLTDGRSRTVPELEGDNIFMSGYNGTLLRYLEAGFDNEKFIEKLLLEYEKSIGEDSLKKYLEKN